VTRADEDELDESPGGVLENVLAPDEAQGDGADIMKSTDGGHTWRALLRRGA